MSPERTDRFRRGTGTARAVVPWFVVLLLAIPAPATAVVSVGPGGDVRSDAEADVITVTCVDGKLWASGATADDLCNTLTQIFISPGAGMDTVDLSGMTATEFPLARPVVLGDDGEGETDVVTGSPLADVIFAENDQVEAGGGDDTILGGLTVGGGAGDDTVIGMRGVALTGGPGDDRFLQSMASEGMDGGAGYDVWVMDRDEYTGVVPGLTESLTLSAESFVEQYGGTIVKTTSYPMVGVERVELTLLRAGEQWLDASAFPGVIEVDALSGTDTVIGGAFADELNGGTGNDVLTGNGGADAIVGGDGDDTVQARDGLADRVDCGAGTDTAVADAVDVVVNCETIDLPLVAAPPVVNPPVVTPPPPAPVVPATTKVKGPSSVVKGSVATFKLKSPTAGATFQCKLDKGAWKACKATHKVKTTKLKLGKHKLQVRAVLAGVVDPTPSVKRFTITS